MTSDFEMIFCTQALSNMLTIAAPCQGAPAPFIFQTIRTKKKKGKMHSARVARVLVRYFSYNSIHSFTPFPWQRASESEFR